MSRSIKIVAALFMAALAAWVFFSPYLAVNSMKSAADRRDAETLSGYVDFPALKENLKSTLLAQMMDDAANSQDDDPFGAVGTALAMAMAGPMIDAMITPTAVEMMMKGDMPSIDEKSESRSTDTDMSMYYKNFSTFIVSVKERDATSKPIGLIFKRHGIGSWKLSGVQMPGADIGNSTAVAQPQVDPPAQAVFDTFKPEAALVENTASENISEAPTMTPEEVQENSMIRQAILDGNGPPGEFPRYNEYRVLDVYEGPPAALDMSGESARNYKTRLREALAEGNIAAAGEFILAGWGCGASCYYHMFVSKRTGEVVEQGLGGEYGEILTGVDVHSRLVITEGPEIDDDYNEIGYFAKFYELSDGNLNLIKKVQMPRALSEE